MTTALARLSPSMSERDAALEAFDVAASFVDADGRHTDEELDALVAVFGRWLPHLRGATAADLRRNELVRGKRAWSERPSAMFEVLVAADGRDGTTVAHDYYE